MKPRDLPIGLTARAFHVSEALKAGETRRRLRARDLITPHRGVRSSRLPSSLTDRILDAAPLLGRHAAFSHVTAAAIWGLPIPWRERSSGDLHVVVAAGRGPRRPGIIAHRSPLERKSVDDLPVVSPVEAWVQSAELLDLDALIEMGDALIGRWSEHPEAHDLPGEVLVDAVRAAFGRRGVRKLRRALLEMRPGSWSPQETRLRLFLQRGGIVVEPELNARVFDGSRYLGRGDLVFREARLVIEYEGDGHRVDPETWARDIRRRERFADAGWRLLRVTKDDLENHKEELLARVARLIDEGRMNGR